VSRESRSVPETVGFVREQQSRPALLLVVWSGHATLRRGDARLRARWRSAQLCALVCTDLRDGLAVARPPVCRLCGAAHDLGVLPRAGTVGEKALPLLRDFGLRA
jgi:hypothetical protein